MRIEQGYHAVAVQGRVDGMQGRYVTGWALPATGRKHCSIVVTDETGGIIARGRASLDRPDLSVLGLGRCDLAFRLELPGCPQRQLFHVSANGAPLPGSPLELGPGCYDDDCAIDAGVLHGWVAERVPDLTAPAISIVSQHGTLAGQGQSRRDASMTRATFAIELKNCCFGAGELHLRVFADGTEFTTASCTLSLQGKLDLLKPDFCAGWLFAPDAPRRRLEIEVFRNDVAVARAGCTITRNEAGDVHPEGARPGFAAHFPLNADAETAPAKISLRLPGSPIELFGGPFLVAGKAAAILAAQRAAGMAHGATASGPANQAVLQLALRHFIDTARTGDGFAAPLPAPPATKTREGRLDIIIPVYRNVAATRACIESVLAHRSAALDRVVLINDASPESGMAALLEQYRLQPNCFVLTNAHNLGFVKTINRGLAFAGNNDVLLLNSDTVVFAGAFAELHAVAHASAGIGTVTAISNDATIFSYPGHDSGGAPLDDCDWAELAEVALSANAGIGLEVPTAHGFCMLIKAEVLRRTGAFDERFGRGYCEENDFCARAADLGYRHVAAAGVFVQHGGGLSFEHERDGLLRHNLAELTGRYPEYLPALRDFARRDGLRAARWALDAWRLNRARKAGAQFALVIANSLGGGSAKAITDIEQAVGYGEAMKLSLICRLDGSMALSAATPLFHAGFSACESAEVFTLLDAAEPSLVLVHQLLGYPAAFLRRLETWIGSKAANCVYYVHDFYALCPRVTCIDAIGEFCNVRDAKTCRRCVEIGGVHDASRLNDTDPTSHRALFARLLRGCTQVIAPSASAAEVLRRGFPSVQVAVVPHPEPGDTPRPPIRQAEDDEEIVLFGALGPHKGSGKLLELAGRARMTHPFLHFRVIGYTDLDEELLALGNVYVTGRYTADMLPVLAAEARGNIALFLHQWPETYSYTLSEALSLGFLPLVPDIGAPAERVRALGCGVVYPFPATAAEILRLIEEARTGRVSRAIGD